MLDASKQWVMVRKFAAARKQQGEASALAPKVASKVAQKEKNNVKDNRSFKKAMGPSIGVDHMDQ